MPGHRGRPAPLVLLTVLLLGSLVGCGGAEPIVLRVDPSDAASVDRVGVRVWDTEMALVVDRWLEVGQSEGQVSFPWDLTLVPAEPPDGRWFLAEIELYDADGCPFARAVVEGPADPAVEEGLTFTDTGFAGCAAEFVASEGAAGPCSETAPCADLEAALDRLASLEAPGVLHLRGDRDYPLGQDGLVFSGDRSGAPGQPLMLRAWPGTGLPRLTAEHVDDANRDGVISVCCGESGSGAGSDLVFDGLDLSGTKRFGVQFNGEPATGSVVRHCEMHDLGLPDAAAVCQGASNPFCQQGPAGVVSQNNATGIGVEYSRVRRILSSVVPAVPASGLAARGGQLAADSNVLQEVEGVGLYSGDSSWDAVFTRNVLCRNAEGGILAHEDDTLAANSVVNNRGPGVALAPGTTATVIDNLIAFNDGPALREVDEVAAAMANWIFGNAEEPRPAGGDADPLLLAPERCLVTPREDSPLRGPSGGRVGARRL